MSLTPETIAKLRVRGYDDARARFAREAFDGGAAEAAYGSIGSPIGDLLTVVSHRGVLAIGFESDDSDTILGSIAAKVTPSIIDLPSAVDGVAGELDAYFRGDLRSFRSSVDRSLMTPFQRNVLDATEQIPMGEVRSYGEIAAAAGKPKGAQAAGQALGANPIPIIIPCHRVVAADGSLRGYAGGLDRKQFLLDLERGPTRLF